MKRKAIITAGITAIAVLFVAWWNQPDSLGYVTLDKLPQVLNSFDATSKDRSDGHHSTTIMFENLSYYVSTQEMKKTEGDQWGYVSSGASRRSGYFVVPRMQWAETLSEVEEIIRADYRRGIGIPTATLGH